MTNCEPLAWFGALIVLVCGAFILVPYLRHRGELISAWTILLLGIAIFLGLGSIEAWMSPMRFMGLEWFQPTKTEVHRYLGLTTLFMVVLLGAHYYDPASKAIAARCFNKWPPFNVSSFIFVLVVCFLIIGANAVTNQITFLGPLVLNFSHKGIIFSSVFAFAMWYENRRSLLWLTVFVVVFVFDCLLGSLAGGGRRVILSVVVGPILYAYMAHLRHWKPAKALVGVALATFVVFALTLMYSSIRHFDRTSEHEARSAANLIAALRQVGSFRWIERFRENKISFLSQQSIHYSLLADHFISTGQLQPRPLNTLVFMAVYPIPRRIWPDKPKALGEVIVHDTVGYATTSWGCGVTGQAVYEGGYITIAIYAYLIMMMTRLVDDPLQRQPTNPFLISMLTAAAPQILAWPRGDLGIMSNEIVECFLFAFALGIVGRFLFGTERSSPTQSLPEARYPLVHQTPLRQS
jgi:hypothetical protein